MSQANLPLSSHCPQVCHKSLLIEALNHTETIPKLSDLYRDAGLD